jgi:N-ethylmaleimide reductase
VSELVDIFEPLQLGQLRLNNRVVMAPMTRSRAGDDELVTAMHVDYYSQRASAGLIITEGVQPSRDGKGYCRTPGIYSPAQVEAWRKVTDAVHQRGGQIVCQLMHCGRVGHPLNKAADAESVAPSAIACGEKIYTEQGMLPMPVPRALATEEIAGVIEQYRLATENAYAAGFDGVELHCTSGYLPAQFLSTGTNLRQDHYGGSLENRLRFVLEVLAAMTAVDGAGRVGMRICPGNPFNDLHDDDPLETFSALLQRVDSLQLAYLHVIRMAATGIDNLQLASGNFSGPLIVNDSYDAVEAEQVIASGEAAAVSFGRLFIANPDLVERFKSGAGFNNLDPGTLYTAGATGYTDYPAYC